MMRTGSLLARYRESGVAETGTAGLLTSHLGVGCRKAQLALSSTLPAVAVIDESPGRIPGLAEVGFREKLTKLGGTANLFRPNRKWLSQTNG